MSDHFSRLKDAMVRDQLEARGITDPKIIAAFRKVDRHLFVSDDLINEIYSDTPLSIGFGQTISQPYVVALMLSELTLKSTDKVLEIGSGSGYEAALLAELVSHVYTVELIPELAKESEILLNELGYKNITTKAGDGYDGWREFAPFDKIIVSAAPEDIPRELVRELKVGGKMILPLGVDYQELVLIEKTKDGITSKELGSVKFVPMIEGVKGKS